MTGESTQYVGVAYGPRGGRGGVPSAPWRVAIGGALFDDRNARAGGLASRLRPRSAAPRILLGSFWGLACHAEGTPRRPCVASRPRPWRRRNLLRLSSPSPRRLRMRARLRAVPLLPPPAPTWTHASRIINLTPRYPAHALIPPRAHPPTRAQLPQLSGAVAVERERPAHRTRRQRREHHGVDPQLRRHAERCVWLCAATPAPAPMEWRGGRGVHGNQRGGGGATSGTRLRASGPHVAALRPACLSACPSSLIPCAPASPHPFLSARRALQAAWTCSWALT